MPSTFDDNEVSLEEKVAYLRRVDSYAEHPHRVDAVETHMSWVFLTDQRAYKLKKPVQLESLDYSTIEARRHFTAEEVRLNQRLASGIYLGTVPLIVTSTGRLAIDGTGEAVDWLVLMRRLPRSARLDTLACERRVPRALLADALAALAGYYAESKPIGLDTGAFREHLRQAIERNRRVLALAAPHLPPEMARLILQRQLDCISRNGSPVIARAGRVIEAHGDLRPEHVYLLEPPKIVDRLDFNRDLRLLDPADELAFLALECERLGAAWIGTLAFQTHERVTGDRPPDAVIAFYRSLRACMRARLALSHLDTPERHEASPWHATAARYLELAAADVAAFTGA